MNKEDIIKELKLFKKGILDFQDSKIKIINIPTEDIEIDYTKYNKEKLDKNPAYKNALFSHAYTEKSKQLEANAYNNKSLLKQTYGKLEFYISKLGQNPLSTGGTSYYQRFFLKDDFTLENISYKTVVSDLDFILGKLESISEKEFQEICFGKKDVNYYQFTNPIYWIVLLFQYVWKYKMVSSIIGFILMVICTSIFTDSLKPITDKISMPLSKTLSGMLNDK